MITHEQIEALLNIDGRDLPILSVYLDVSPARQITAAYRTAFRDLASALDAQADGEVRIAVARESQRVASFLASQYEPRGTGLAIFSSEPLALWQVYHLPSPVSDNVLVGMLPYVRPLLETLDEYERYGVVLVDKERARLFSVYLGEIEEQRGVFDIVPPKHRQGGWASPRFRRHHDDAVRSHAKHTADVLAEFARRWPFDRLIVGGPPEALSEFLQLLPRGLRRRLAGTVQVELFASPAEVLARTLEIEERIERADEEQQVAELLELAGPSGKAVVGLAAVLAAASQGRVHRLVVAEGYSHSGAVCDTCASLSAERDPMCRTCRQPTHRVADIVALVASRIISDEGQVETVRGPAAARLRESGAVGALVRF